jgi:hypothetical protein
MSISSSAVRLIGTKKGPDRIAGAIVSRGERTG